MPPAEPARLPASRRSWSKPVCVLTVEMPLPLADSLRPGDELDVVTLCWDRGGSEMALFAAVVRLLPAFVAASALSPPPVHQP